MGRLGLFHPVRVCHDIRLLGQTAENEHKGRLLLLNKKIKKLYFLHLIMLFMGVVFKLLKHETILGILRQLAVTIPLLQTWFPVEYMAINSVAWYLSDCVFYISVFLFC